MGLSWMKYPLAFIAGGLIFSALFPLIRALLLSMLIFLMIGLVLALIGFSIFWLIYFPVTLLRLFLFGLPGRIARTLILAAIFAVITMVFDSPLTSFLLGGVLGVQLVWSPTPPRIIGRQRPAPAPSELRRGVDVAIPLGKSGSILPRTEGLTEKELDAGVLVTGLRARTAARTLMLGLLERGYKIVALGSRRLAPPHEGVVVYECAAVDLFEDFKQYDFSPDCLVYALAIANRLRNDDVSMLLPVTRLVWEGVIAGRVEPDQILQSIEVQDRRLSPLMASIVAAMSRNVKRGGVSASRLVRALEEADAVIVEVPGVERGAIFMIAYLTLMISNVFARIRGRAAFILENPEILVKDINLFGYESREPWERVYLALEYLKGFGLILVARDSPKTGRVWELCGTRVLTYMSDIPREVYRGSRQLEELLEKLRQEEVVVYGESIRAFRLTHTPARAVEPIRMPEAAALREGVVVVAGPPAQTAVVERRRPTLLEEMFGDDAAEAAAILDKCGRSVSVEELRSYKPEVVEKLKKVGFIRDDILLGHAILTEPGEHALKEYREALKTGLAPEPGPRPPAGAEAAPSKPAQALIDADEALERVDEVDALYARVESLWRQQKYPQAVMAAYKYMVQALKRAYNIETGHLDDIVQRIGGEAAGITLEEAKTAKTLMIAAGRGEAGINEATRMVLLARKVRARLSSIGGGGGG